MRTVLLSALVAVLAPVFAVSGQSQASAPAAQPARDSKPEPKPDEAAIAPADPAKLAAPKDRPGAAAAGALPVDTGTFVIGAQDILLITVIGEAQLSKEYLVRPDGFISMPYAGDVKATGQTCLSLGEQITKKLKDWFNEPMVYVEVRTIRSTEYYMDGEWNKPAEYPLIVPTRVFEAITKAGGFREWANQKKVLIVRGNTILKFNYKEVSQGKRPEQNVFVQPGDHIVAK